MLSSPLILDTFTIFYAILIEAAPFIVLGVLVSAAISVFVSEETFVKIIPRQPILAHLAIAILGFLFPVCECGNMPVARRLIAKGLPVSQAITFLLAAPVVNPVVILSTYTAFKFAPELVVLRILVSFVVAVIVGLIFSCYPDEKDLITREFHAYCTTNKASHEHSHQTQTFFSIIITETFQVIAALLIGAFIAAVISVSSRESIFAIAHTPLLAIVTMMLLAFVMTICSTVDAFVALGYVSIFPLSSILAFLTFGPMIDIRSISMMLTTFRARTVIVMAVLVFQCVLISSVIYSLLGR